MVTDAIVLAGGRASRLGGISKPALRHRGSTLLQIAIGAMSSARQIVVVGDAADVSAAAPGSAVFVTREVPAFSGPAAAIAAGLDRLATPGLPPADFTIVVACDMPRVAEVVGVLVGGVRTESDGIVAVSTDGRVQHLAAAYSTGPLRERVAEHRDAGDLDGLSVRALVAGLKLDRLAAEPGSTDDIDTWTDAERFGFVPTHPISI